MSILSVNIGHIDSGISAQVAASGRIAAFKYFGCNGLAQTAKTCDETGHGSITANIILQTAPKAQLYCAAAIDSGHVFARILSAMTWMLSQPIELLIMPIGIPQHTQIFDSSIAEFAQRNIPIIVPVGNNGDQQIYSPSASAQVFSVGAIESDGQVSTYSSCYQGEHNRWKPDIYAHWGQHRGTSFSCAYVGACIAHLKSLNPCYSTQQIIEQLRLTASAINHPTHQAKRYNKRAAALMANPAGCINLDQALIPV